jgi:aspartyl-tRNA(Asn)/glutamyl-tRNA(Gln) amidotransferase subunit B
MMVIMASSKKDHDPTHLMEEKGFGQISDEGALGKIIDEVIKNYPVQVQQFKDGKEATLKFLLGMIMKATEGSADPKAAEQLLKDKLG